jgi:hypothetical protein
MHNTIILKDGKELIGISNIAISEVDDKIYINNISQINNSIKGALAFYSADNSPALMGTGAECTWNKDASMLEVLNITASFVTATNDVVAKRLVSDFLTVSNIDASFVTATNDVVAKRLVSDCLTVDTVDASFVTATNDVVAKRLVSDFLTVDAIDSNFVSTAKLIVDKCIEFDSIKYTGTQPFKISLGINPQTNNEVLVFSTNAYGDDTPSFPVLGLENNRVLLNGIANIKTRTIVSPIGENTDMTGDIAIDDNFIYYCTSSFDGVSNIWKRCPITGW